MCLDSENESFSVAFILTYRGRRPIISFSGLTPIYSIFSRNTSRRIPQISRPWMKAGPMNL
jgi:hypothetical protein